MLEFLREYRIPLLILSVALVLLSILLEAKRGETEVTALTRLEDELAPDDDEGERGDN